jgi:FkbM family methyltransferase
VLDKLAVWGARIAPKPLKDWIHHTPVLDRFSRRVYGELMGSRIAIVESGPMRGLKLVSGPHVSHAHLRGVYELDTLIAVDRYVRDGFICYDLGASIGYISVLMARRASHVYAFEPAPHAAEEIQRNAAANQMTNISIVPLPVSDNVREVSFCVTDAAFGSAINETETRWPILKLETTTLDRFAAENPAPDFIKIDVEGEEGAVLEGARDLLRMKRPIICCELHSTAAANRVITLLNEFGYSIRTLHGEPFEMGTEIVAGELQVICLPESSG